MRKGWRHRKLHEAAGVRKARDEAAGGGSFPSDADARRTARAACDRGVVATTPSVGARRQADDAAEPHATARPAATAPERDVSYRRRGRGRRGAKRQHSVERISPPPTVPPPAVNTE